MKVEVVVPIPVAPLEPLSCHSGHYGQMTEVSPRNRREM